MRKLLLISCAFLVATPAFAQTVDAKGAKGLAETLSKYVGKTAIKKNIIKVVPEGDSYRVTFSTARLLESMPKQDYFKGDFGEYSLLTKPLADGSWNVSSTSIPSGSVEMSMPTGSETVQWSVDNANMSGIFDPKLGTLAKGLFSYGSFKMKSSSPTGEMEASANSAKGEMNAAAATSGGIDFSSVQSAADFKETITVKSPPSTEETKVDGETATPEPAAVEPMKVSLTGATVGADLKGQGFRNLELLDLWAFFIEHSEEKKLKKTDEKILKAKLVAALPLWEKLSGAYHFDDLNVETPLGAFLAKNISQELSFDGISKSGEYHYALRTNGLKYPALPIPEWSVPFLPTDVEFSFGTSDLDLDTVVRGAIEDVDFSREKPFSDEFEAATAAAFIVSPPKLLINKSLIRTVDAELTVEGEVTFAAMQPESKTTLEMTGFDAIVDRLNKASAQDPDIKQYITFVKLAKDFGTQLPNGHIQWIVDRKADGSVAINGNPVKGPDPVAEPGSDDTLDATTPDDDTATQNDDDGSQDDAVPDVDGAPQIDIKPVPAQ